MGPVDRETVRSTSRCPMVWDYAEANVLSAEPWREIWMAGINLDKGASGDRLPSPLTWNAKKVATSWTHASHSVDSDVRIGCLYRPTLLRQHRLRRPVGLLLRLATPLTEISVPGTVRHRKPYPRLKNWLPRPTGMGTKKAGGGVSFSSRMTEAMRCLAEQCPSRAFR